MQGQNISLLRQMGKQIISDSGWINLTVRWQLSIQRLVFLLFILKFCTKLDHCKKVQCTEVMAPSHGTQSFTIRMRKRNELRGHFKKLVWWIMPCRGHIWRQGKQWAGNQMIHGHVKPWKLLLIDWILDTGNSISLTLEAECSGNMMKYRQSGSPCEIHEAGNNAKYPR